MGVCAEWWRWCGKPGRLPRAAPLSILLTTVLTLIILLFFLNARALNRFASPHHLLDLKDHNMEGVPQHHPDLIAYIRQFHLLPPASGPYNLTYPNQTDFSQNGQSKRIAKIFNNKRNGVFLEAGAYNGESFSNTLYLERELGWHGLLVEPDPWNFWALRRRQRKSHIINACLSPSSFPKELTFKQSGTVGRIANSAEKASKRGIFTQVKCFPLYSILLAFNTTHIDFLSLDLEGFELKILQTVPWEEIQVDVLCVEYRHVPEGGGAVQAFLEGRGFVKHSSIGDDFIFLRKGFTVTP